MWSERVRRLHSQRTRSLFSGLLNENDVEERHYEQAFSQLSDVTTRGLNEAVNDDIKQCKSLMQTYSGSVPQNKPTPGGTCAQNPECSFEQHDVEKIRALGEAVRKLDRPEEDQEATLIDPVPPSSDESEDNSSGEHRDNEVHPNRTSLNCDQKAITELYKRHFENRTATKHQPPPVILMTGQAGTGKSFVIDALDKLAKDRNQVVLKLAFNNSNAIAIGGPTLSTFCLLNGRHTKNFENLQLNDLQKLKETYNLKQVSLIVLDEISNVPAHALARLDDVLRQAMNKPDEPFDGVPVLLIGDLGQKEPVRAGGSIIQHLLKMLEHDETIQLKNDRLKKVLQSAGQKKASGSKPLKGEGGS